jgi:hypothetical protein
MAHVSLNLRSLNIGEKLSLARRVYDAMADNPLFPSPDPPLILLTRLTRELAGQRDSQAIIKNEVLLGETLSRLSSYVQRISGGSPAIITAAGLNLEYPSGINGALPIPANLRVTNGRAAQEVLLRCDPVPGAKTYVFQYTPDPLTPSSVWSIGSVSTGHLGTIALPESNHRYWFNVSAVGPAGQGPWSEPVAEIVT